MTRTQIGKLLLERLQPIMPQLKFEFATSGPIQSFVVDDVLPPYVAEQLATHFPKPANLMRRKSLRESKYVSSQMDKHHSLLEEAIFAFQDSELVGLLAQMSGIKDLSPDPNLYASGLSVMCKRDFLNPHIDNSHDKDRHRYRVLNVLYYLSPGWELDAGGNLELWNNGPTAEPPRTIVSRFNRLVCMATHRRSWHSVSAVKIPRDRTCISNYYFSLRALDGEDYFHVTSFRGRPNEPIRNLVLRTDAMARSVVRTIFPKGIVAPKHVYKKPPEG